VAASRQFPVLVLCLAVAALAAIAGAQIPQTVNYQLMLTDAADQPLADQTVNMVFRLYDAELGGTLIWSESRSAQTNAIGVVAIVLGETVPMSFEYAGPMWLEVEVDGETMTPRRPLTSAPYARRATVADLAGNAEGLGGIPADAYALDDDLWQPGTLNDPANPMEWTKLKSVPAGFADGTDDVGTGVGGSGTVDYVAKFTGSTTVGNSALHETGGRVTLGTTTPGGILTVVSTTNEPALSLTNSALGSQPKALFVQATQDMTFHDSLIRIEVPEASQSGLLIECTKVGPTGGLQVFYVTTEGFLRSKGLRVDSQSTREETARFQNYYEGSAGRAVEAVYMPSSAYDAVAVYGESKPQDYYGFGGEFVGGFVGAKGKVEPTGGSWYYGLMGDCVGGSGTNYGVRGYSSGSGTNYGVYGSAGGGSENWAGYFAGDARVTGTFVNPGPQLEMDHPSDPENSYLRHALVASPEMKTVYDGTVTLDTAGEAVVLLPDWFEALNGDFRYQLTPIGAPAPGLYVADPVADGRFRIAGGEPGLTVSWQITGVRRDAYAERHPLVVEDAKATGERGRYISPDAHGAPESMAIGGVQIKKERR
jgi:hypothetical protein